MKKKILHTQAEDDHGNLIHVDNAEKGIKYYCCNQKCKKEIIFRSSGKTGKGSRRPHFSHKKGTNPGCSPDRALHDVFIRKLIELLEWYKAEDKPFTINWRCAACNYTNMGNILEKSVTIKREYYLGESRPDIAILDKNEKVLAVIEIVNTHSPEEKTLRYYKNNKITLIQINLISDEDTSRVEEIAKFPHIVDFCINHECPNNDGYKIKRTIFVLPSPCGRRFHEIRKFEIEIDSMFGLQRSLSFSDDEINIVKSNFKNIVLKTEKNSQGIKLKYPIMDCPSCRSMRMVRGKRRL